MRRLKSCRVKLDSGNTRALAIEFGFLFENVYKILLSLEFSVYLKVCRVSRKLLTPVSSLPVQRPVVDNLSDNSRGSWALAFLRKVAYGLGIFGPMPGWVAAMQYGCLLPGEEVQGLSEQE